MAVGRRPNLLAKQSQYLGKDGAEGSENSTEWPAGQLHAELNNRGGTEGGKVESQSNAPFPPTAGTKSPANAASLVFTQEKVALCCYW